MRDSVSPGDGQNAINSQSPASLSGYSYSFTQSVTYNLAGTYTASIKGNVSSYDNVIAYEYDSNNQYRGASYMSPVYSEAGISASTQVQVNNVAPTITQLNWAPDVVVGQTFGFSATATDPGLAGGEVLTFAYDFNGTGQYSDFVQTGGTSDAGTYQFSTTGKHSVGVRVSDGNGGVTYGSFDVQVNAVATPEPTSLTFACTASAVLASWLGWKRRRHQPLA